MRRRLYAKPVAAALIPLAAGGCVQMTRHSNMMIFGTNTVVGVRAGVNAQSVPEVAIGYTRQEAVVLPLVANTGTEKRGSGTVLMPCDLKDGSSAKDGRAYATHPCSLVARYGEALDSYSVLASFGGDFTAKGSRDAPEASGGVAQYFATGVAAQMLALSGGAGVVATGEAAKAGASKSAVSKVGTVFFKGANLDVSNKVNDDYTTWKTAILEKIKNQDLGTKKATIAEIDIAAGLDPFAAENSCSTADGCDKIVNSDKFRPNYPYHREKMDAIIGK